MCQPLCLEEAPGVFWASWVVPWEKVWVLFLLLELSGTTCSQRMDKIQICPGVEKNLLGKVPVARKPRIPWKSPRLPQHGVVEKMKIMSLREEMKLCIGGNPYSPQRGPQGLALGWGHSDTAWGTSWAGLL